MEKYHKQDVAPIEKENERDENYEAANPQIDSKRTRNNYRFTPYFGKTYTEFINCRIKELGLSPRKDAVVMNSFVLGSDKTFFDGLVKVEQYNFFSDCYKFFAEAVREENQVYVDALTEAKSGNIPRKRGKLQEQVIALTADNVDLSKRLTKAMDETLEYARKAETLQKEKENNSHYTNVGKELARTNPTEYRRIVHGKPKTINNFFDSVLSLFTQEVTRQVPRLQLIEAELEEERKKQEKRGKSTNYK